MMRIAKIGAGFVLLILGVAMLALPGPGWAAIFAALAILATEFDWARRALDRLKALFARVTSRNGGKNSGSSAVRPPRR